MNLFVAFIIAFLIGTYSIPIVIKISKEKRIFDEPDERKLNKTVIPTLGGISIFLAVILSTLIGLYQQPFENLHYIMGGMILIFFTGIKDDLINIAPMKKLMMQILAALLIIILADIRFTNLHGFLGIYELNFVMSIAITLFTFVVLTNGINLIDGIDGLAASVAIIASATLGWWFYHIDLDSYAVMAAALTGSFAAFFIFNVFGVKNKIFMGDTGSLLLGYILTIFVIQFNESNITGLSTIYNPIAVSLAILVLPVFDTARVFLIRASQKKSPFLPDQNHLHHLVLKIVDKHIKATLFFATANIIIIISTMYFTQKMGFYSGILFVLVLGGFMVSLPEIILKVKETQEYYNTDNESKKVKKVRFEMDKPEESPTKKYPSVN